MADGEERGAKRAPPVAFAPTHVVGAFVAWDAERGAMVDYPGSPGPLPAASIVALDEARVSAAIAISQRVLLAFDGGRADAPIVIGFIQNPSPVEAEVDGERVVIEGKNEIVLRCGLASITLRRNGRVVIRGTHVETRARGVNRIRGGTVQIN